MFLIQSYFGEDLNSRMSSFLLGKNDIEMSHNSNINLNICEDQDYTWIIQKSDDPPNYVLGKTLEKKVRNMSFEI